MDVAELPARDASRLDLGRGAGLDRLLDEGARSGALGIDLDGIEVADVAITTATVQPGPDHIYIGLEWVGTVTSQVAVDAWFDDILVDSSPITCSQ